MKLLSTAWRYNPKANLTNEVRFGFNWAPFDLPRGAGHPEVLLAATSGSLILPAASPTRSTTSARQGRNTDTYHFADNANWVHTGTPCLLRSQAQVARIEQYNDAGITPTYTLGTGSGNTRLTAPHSRDQRQDLRLRTACSPRWPVT